MANINITSDAWTEISITSGTVQNISATADIELSAEQTDNSGVVLKPSELYQWDNETIYARAVTEDTGALRVVNFKKAAGGGGGYVLPVATASKLGGVKVGGGLSIDENGVLSAPVSYSTTEQVIGTWIDGKPLYQISFQTTAPATANTNTDIVSLDSYNVKAVVSLDFWIDNSSSIGTINFNSGITNRYNREAEYECWIYAGNTNYTPPATPITIKGEVGSAFIAKPMVITIKYTKTTD